MQCPKCGEMLFGSPTTCYKCGAAMNAFPNQNNSGYNPTKTSTPQNNDMEIVFILLGSFMLIVSTFLTYIKCQCVGVETEKVTLFSGYKYTTDSVLDVNFDSDGIYFIGIAILIIIFLCISWKIPLLILSLINLGLVIFETANTCSKVSEANRYIQSIIEENDFMDNSHKNFTMCFLHPYHY